MMKSIKPAAVFLLINMLFAHPVHAREPQEESHTNGILKGKAAADAKENYHLVSRSDYVDRLEGFWLGACIANWTGLVTEMDKIGDTPKFKTGRFYTRHDWGQPDLPNIWSEKPSDLSATIDFVFRNQDEVWGADDDTDIEYMYQHLLLTHKTSILSPQQIRSGWLKHIRSEEENYLWVSNERAFHLMQQGMLPPATSHPTNNPEYEMIDAQLTTEIFGLFSPTRPDFALKMANLPIHTAARDDAAWIAQFYVTMYSLAGNYDKNQPIDQHLRKSAGEARKRLPENSYTAKMFDYVVSLRAKKRPGSRLVMPFINVISYSTRMATT